MVLGIHATTIGKEDADDEQVRHLLTMIPKMRVFVTEGKIDKVFRWLGFLQGVLWSTHFYTLDELKEHNREDAPLPHTAT